MVIEKERKNKDWMDIVEAIATITLIIIGGFKTWKKA